MTVTFTNFKLKFPEYFHCAPLFKYIYSDET